MDIFAKVHMRYTAPRPLYDDCKDYYKGGKTQTMQITSADDFVQKCLLDPRAVVLKTAFRQRSDTASMVALSLHAIDCDAENLDKVALRDRLRRQPNITLAELFQEFPALSECCRQAHALCEGARARGKQAVIISTGFKGFRVIVSNADPELYLIVPAASIKGSATAVKDAVQPRLKEFFGELPPCIDYSVWGENKGVRTNLHSHPVTGLYPLIISDDNLPYGSTSRDAKTHSVLLSFWTACVTNVSLLDIPNDAPSASPARSKRKRGTGNDVEENIVQTILAERGWVAQNNSIQPIGNSRRKVSVIMDKSKSTPYTCNIAGRVHANNTFRAVLDLSSRTILSVHCMDQDCQSSNTPFLDLLKKAGSLTNHAVIAQGIAAEIRKQLVFDGKAWRSYRAETGCWHQCETRATPIDAVFELLQSALERLHPDDEDDVSLVLKARSMVGNTAVLSGICNMLEHGAFVSKDKWTSHFQGYLPVQNKLLQFCSTTVIAHDYRPDHYIRAEYQATFVYWNPDAPACAQLEALLNSWWDPTERNAWLQALAYALSRCAFAEKFFLGYGPPGSSKSRLLEMLQKWFGQENIFSHENAAYVVQNNPYARTHDEDGNAHNTALVTCFNKALVVYPEPSDKAVFRDARIKTMTGDIQTARVAHDPVIRSVPRSYTPLMLTNYLPRPSNPSDTAIMSRIEILTMHRVFYRNEQHKQELLKKMTPEQQQEAQMRPADTNVVDAVIKSPEAATAFLNLLAAAWYQLNVVNKRQFQPSDLAKTVAKSYWSTVTTEGDSVDTFLTEQVHLENSAAILPKKNLWLAYKAWHAWYTNINGSPGPIAKSDDSFKKRVRRFYNTLPFDDTPSQPTVYLLNEHNPLQLQTFATPKVRCYLGLTLKPCPEAYYSSSEQIP